MNKTKKKSKAAAGASGGKSRSKAKRAAARANLLKAHASTRNPEIAALMKKEGLSRQAAWYRLRKGKTKVTK